MTTIRALDGLPCKRSGPGPEGKVVHLGWPRISLGQVLCGIQGTHLPEVQKAGTHQLGHCGDQDHLLLDGPTLPGRLAVSLTGSLPCLQVRVGNTEAQRQLQVTAGVGWSGAGSPSSGPREVFLLRTSVYTAFQLSV